ncbi:hypothetical protein WJX73_005959 [Symbiochloris irregularis]|uniref:Uncharacterized protein n=1 Tax=Symbiochloris irregularis TaxID=706552 RepID=A0AAW1NVU0_9CHLO
MNGAKRRTSTEHQPIARNVICTHPVSAERPVSARCLGSAKRPYRENSALKCSCIPVSEGGEGCGDRCLNRILYIECIPEVCPCGHACTNRRLQQRQYAKTRVCPCGDKGKGLVALQDIQEGDLVIEYVGEVIGRAEGQSRAERYSKAGRQHVYVMKLSAEVLIDATERGGDARFVNHSCAPNCEAERWQVGHEERIAVVAAQDIKAGQEITYDYRLSDCTAQSVRCCCGAEKCRGWLSAPTMADLAQDDPSSPDPLHHASDCEEGGASEGDREQWVFDQEAYAPDIEGWRGHRHRPHWPDVDMGFNISDDDYASSDSDAPPHRQPSQRQRYSAPTFLPSRGKPQHSVGPAVQPAPPCSTDSGSTLYSHLRRASESGPPAVLLLDIPGSTSASESQPYQMAPWSRWDAAEARVQRSNE